MADGAAAGVDVRVSSWFADPFGGVPGLRSGHATFPLLTCVLAQPAARSRFTSVLGVVLLVGITVLFVTGLVSYAAYNPGLSPVNDQTPDKGLLGFYLFSWPTHPSWLYRLTQGVHVTLGIALIPVLLAKLWSVVPKLFALPPARSLAHALERLSLLLLVGGGLFEFTTGVLNVQLDYIFPGSFYPLHFYGAWVFFAAFLAHAVLKTPLALRNLRHLRDEQPSGEGELVSPNPAEPTVSRRGAPSVWWAADRCCCSLRRRAAASTDRCGRRRSSHRTAGPNRAAVQAGSRSTRRPPTRESARRRPERKRGGWS